MTDCNHLCGDAECIISCWNKRCAQSVHDASPISEVNEEIKIPSKGDGWSEMTKDPNSYIQASAEQLAETLLSKNQDYAPTGEFSNFEKAAEIAGIGPMHVITAQAAIKMTRIESLTNHGGYNHESLTDSFLDLAGYAIIAHAYLTANSNITEEPEESEDYKFPGRGMWDPAG